jgi:hypothetical protein
VAVHPRFLGGRSRAPVWGQSRRAGLALLDRDAHRRIQPHHGLDGVDRSTRVCVLAAHPLGRFNRRVGLHDINSDLNPLEGDYVLADELRLGAKAAYV